MGWLRTPYGYLSGDRRWFLERGARMTHGSHAWLIWRRAEAGEYATDEFGAYDLDGSQPLRTLRELCHLPDDTLYLDAHLEGGWLAEAKAIVLAEATTA